MSSHINTILQTPVLKFLPSVLFCSHKSPFCTDTNAYVKSYHAHDTHKNNKKVKDILLLNPGFERSLVSYFQRHDYCTEALHNEQNNPPAENPQYSKHC